MKKLFLRIGEWDRDDPRPSFNNFATGTRAIGLSVFELDHGVPVVPSESEYATTDLLERLERDDPKYLVHGEVVGVGHDGEPLLWGPVAVGAWLSPTVRFKGAEASALAIDPMLVRHTLYVQTAKGVERADLSGVQFNERLVRKPKPAPEAPRVETRRGSHRAISADELIRQALEKYK